MNTVFFPFNRFNFIMKDTNTKISCKAFPFTYFIPENSFVSCIVNTEFRITVVGKENADVSIAFNMKAEFCMMKPPAQKRSLRLLMVVIFNIN